MRVCLSTVPYHECAPYVSYEHLRCSSICPPIIPSFRDYSPSRNLWIIIAEYGLCQEKWLWMGMGPGLGPLSRHGYCVCLLGHGTFVDWVLRDGKAAPRLLLQRPPLTALATFLSFFWQESNSLKIKSCGIFPHSFKKKSLSINKLIIHSVNSVLC